jgi:hypothetical protein
MKHLFTLLFIFLSATLVAQHSEDFESFTSGDDILSSTGWSAFTGHTFTASNGGTFTPFAGNIYGLTGNDQVAIYQKWMAAGSWQLSVATIIGGTINWKRTREIVIKIGGTVSKKIAVDKTTANWVVSTETFDTPSNGATVRIEILHQNESGLPMGVDNFSITSTLSTKQINDFQFNIYPNPAKDVISFQSELPLESVEIFSLTGSKVLSQSNNVRQVEVGNLAKGIYMLKASAVNGKVATQKLIKE